MKDLSSPILIRAALVSVGGSPAPVLHVLRQHSPAHVWYFCSADSRAKADEIQSLLAWHPQARFIEVKCFEELGPCYRELRSKIPEILAETKVAPAEVLVDYTGGTKTMSAALVLAASEVFHQFSYVGGEQREKEGLGVTVDGKERVLYQSNPWTELAVREIERACDLWAGRQFEAAADVLRKIAPRVAHRLRFEAIADLAEAMAARHRLDFRSALQKLTMLRGRPPEPGKIALLNDGLKDDNLARFVSSSYELCAACSKDTASETFLRELLDNTFRTAAQGRYEDASARLYRAMEMRGQIWLTEATEGAFLNGKLKTGSALPEPLAALPFCKPDECGEVNLSLERIYITLHQLGDDRASRVAADIKLSGKSLWRQATEKRNTSILAHGVQAIGKDGFSLMKQRASEFLGFTLESETNPIQPLDPRWLTT